MTPFKNDLKETVLNQPSPEAKRLPFYNHLPKDEVGLLMWRVYVRERCIKDVEFRQTILQMCALDPCFFIATFVDIHETRPVGRHRGPHNVPFFLWTDQVDVIAWVAKDIGQRDIVVSKSRGIGMSWTYTAIYIWIWLFVPGADLALVSKDEDSLDIVGRPSTLMGKLDYIYRHLPFWMRTDEDGKEILIRTSQNHRFENRLNRTAIMGFVPTSQKLRGGRFYCVLFDEFAFVEADPRELMAATQHISFCRIWLSTFNGMGNLFHRIAHDEVSPLLRIKTFWWANPSRAAGMYTSKNGVIELIDKSYHWPTQNPDYPFVADGMLRSPFFDFEMARAGADRQAMLEELNGVAAAATRKLFQNDYVPAINRHTKPPTWRGHLTWDGEWVEDFEGPWHFWRHPTLPANLAVVGGDPSSGVESGAFSALTGIDADTGEHICTYSGHLPPIELARLANLAGRVLAGPSRYAILNWETTGSLNGAFTNEISRLRYPRLFVDELGHVGYHNRDRGEAILWEVGRALRDGELVLYDARIAEELLGFEWNRDGELEWAGSEGHADRAMAFAIAWMAAKSRRKAILRERRQRDIIISLGPDAEPELVMARRNADVWSTRFTRKN